MAPTTRKRLFLVDAMGYIFRAYFAPMDRLQTSTGIPTKVPYLFATMMRRLLTNKDSPPGLRGRGLRRRRAHFSRQAFRRLQSPAAADAGRSCDPVAICRRYCEAMRLLNPGISRLRSRRRDRHAFAARIEKGPRNLYRHQRQGPDAARRWACAVLNPAKGDLLVDEKRSKKSWAFRRQKWRT